MIIVRALDLLRVVQGCSNHSQQLAQMMAPVKFYPLYRINIVEMKAMEVKDVTCN